MTRKGGTSQACASCRYQRRRCKSDCPLAPYFPADQPDMFHNAHRLFGVSNITKLLKQIDPNLRGVAMKSIIEEANARAKYPVYGCVAEIQQLMLKIQLAEEELMAVHSQLAFYTQQQQQRPDHHQPDNNPLLPCLQLGTAATVVNPSPLQYTAAASAIPVSHNNPSAYFSAYANTDNSRDNSCWVQQLYENGNGGNSSNNNNNNQMVTMVQQEPEEMGLGSGPRPAPPQEQPITIQVQGNIEDDDYDEMMYPFFDTIDDRQSYIDSKEPYESSSESSFKDIAQSVSENELKNAAACFTLTSINV
ncbi:hypothetical protein DM860_003234 [Cuscuta australis]|uniref:LOB domain-containing protein n=1 Tax=Cuscuta australis TaxID=267555 RepID=A0A328D5T5_9ASTE|nr:hypothetical protein DM860_003234 [Cuscuta australis]